MTPVLYIVIPCYNEEQVLKITIPTFCEKLNSLINSGKVSNLSRILFVDDGSKDSTWELINKTSLANELVCGISLSRNKGHQNALLAGLMEAKEKCDITISIDCDGQDDINAIDNMVDEYLSGSEIVYGVRKDRSSDTFFKKTSAKIFYKTLDLLGVESVYNHADYRLLSSRVLNELEKFKEVNIYLRGMIPLVGFKSSCVYYKREKRTVGKSHYTLSKMLSLGLNGITSLSVKPIRIITVLGFFVALLSFVGIIWSVITAIVGKSVAGWASLTSILCFLGGVQLLSIGIIGEYIGKIYLETKARPKYIISEKTKNNN